MTYRRTVVVIGAGIVGVACAVHLLRDGHHVTLIDREGPGEGCSKGNAGAISPGSCIPLALPGMYWSIPGWLLNPLGPLSIRPSYFPRVLPWLIRFSLASRLKRVEQIADAMRSLHARTYENYEPLLEIGNCGNLVRRTGTLIVYEKEANDFDHSLNWALRKQRGVRFEILDADQVREIVPELGPQYKQGVLLPDHASVIDPGLLVVRVAEGLVRRGGTLLRSNVRAIIPSESGAQVVLDDRTLSAERVIVAAGAWSTRLLGSLDVRLPLESQRGYHAMLAAPGISPRVPVVSSSGKFYVTPMAGGIRIAGTVEFAGLDAPPNYRRAEALVIAGKRMFPGLNTESFTAWMGHRPCLPDSLPVIGAAPGHRSVLLAFGHGHNGLTGASTTGRLIADLVSGRDSDIDLTPFRADRF